MRKTRRYYQTALARLLVAVALGLAVAAPAASQGTRPRPFNELDPSLGNDRVEPNRDDRDAGEETDETDTDEADTPDRDAIEGQVTEAEVADEQAIDTEPQRTIEPVDDPDPEPDPYDALGIRMGSFLLFPRVTVEALYTDNVLESATERHADHALVVDPEFRLRSNWSRHEFEAGVGLRRSYFEEFTSENDKDFDADLRARIDIRRRTSLETELAYAISQESRGDIDFPTGAAERPDETVSSITLTLEHRVNRVTVRLRGVAAQEEFGDVTLIDGETVNNDDRNNLERELQLRLAYAFRRDVALFVEGSRNEIEFARGSGGGQLSDSSGYEIGGGLSFEMGGKISGEFGIGVARQTPDDPTLKGIERPVVNANLTWRATGLTTFEFNATSELDATTITDSLGSLTQTLDFSVEHLLRRNIILGASVNYEIEDFGGSDFEQTEVTTSLSAEYLLNRSLALIAEYEHTEFSSTDPNDDYTENQLQVGVRLRR